MLFFVRTRTSCKMIVVLTTRLHVGQRDRQDSEMAAASMADTASTRSCDSYADRNRPTPSGAGAGVASSASNILPPPRKALPPIHPYLQSVMGEEKEKPHASADAGRVATDVQGERPSGNVNRAENHGYSSSTIPISIRAASVDRSGLLYTDAAHLVFDKGD